MAKLRATKKDINNAFYYLIEIGYADIQYLTMFKMPAYYTCGINGWNSDVYIVNNNTAIVTGYKPFGNIHPDYEIIKKYNGKAEKIYKNWDIDQKTKEKKINKLFDKFIMEVI